MYTYIYIYIHTYIHAYIHTNAHTQHVSYATVKTAERQKNRNQDGIIQPLYLTCKEHLLSKTSTITTGPTTLQFVRNNETKYDKSKQPAQFTLGMHNRRATLLTFIRHRTKKRHTSATPYKL